MWFSSHKTINFKSILPKHRSIQGTNFPRRSHGTNVAARAHAHSHKYGGYLEIYIVSKAIVLVRVHMRTHMGPILPIDRWGQRSRRAHMRTYIGMWVIQKPTLCLRPQRLCAPTCAPTWVFRQSRGRNGIKSLMLGHLGVF